MKMTIDELDKIPLDEWFKKIKEYVESTDRNSGIKFYYELLEFYSDPNRFLPGSKEEWVIIDVFDAMCGDCNKDCYIGTGDYHIIE